jgi:hypothetical protein
MSATANVLGVTCRVCGWTSIPSKKRYLLSSRPDPELQLPGSCPEAVMDSEHATHQSRRSGSHVWQLYSSFVARGAGDPTLPLSAAALPPVLAAAGTSRSTELYQLHLYPVLPLLATQPLAVRNCRPVQLGLLHGRERPMPAVGLSPPNATTARRCQGGQQGMHHQIPHPVPTSLPTDPHPAMFKPLTGPQNSRPRHHQPPVPVLANGRAPPPYQTHTTELPTVPTGVPAPYFWTYQSAKWGCGLQAFQARRGVGADAPLCTLEPEWSRAAWLVGERRRHRQPWAHNQVCPASVQHRAASCRWRLLASAQHASSASVGLPKARSALWLQGSHA